MVNSWSSGWARMLITLFGIYSTFFATQRSSDEFGDIVIELEAAFQLNLVHGFGVQ
jgi:hypothetical protein